MDAKISVIIPIYNMELYLERCLDSVLNNTYRNLEVLCIDDGSKDHSLEILRRYEAADSRIVVIAKENGGVSSARNAGLQEMTGDYVCFVDSDDYVHAQYFELLLYALEKTGAQISICSFLSVEIDQTHSTQESFQADECDLQIVSRIDVFKSHDLRSYCWGKLFQRKLLDGIAFRDDLHLSEDTAFFAEVCERADVITLSFIAFPLYFYCQREGSAIMSITPAGLVGFGRVWRDRMVMTQRDDIYLDNAIKWNLSGRYLCSHILFDREAAAECNARLRELCKPIWRTSIYGKLKKAAFLMFIFFPGAFRIVRIVREPYFWKWEQVARRKHQEERESNA